MSTTTTRRLHEIAGDVQAMEELLLEMGGEWTEEVEALFAEVEGSLEQKVDSYSALIREWELDAEKWKAEEQRVAAHRKAREKAAERLKTRLCEYLVQMKRDKVEGARFKVGVQRAASVVEVLCPADKLPDGFKRVVPATVEPDKRAIAAALQHGGELVIGDGKAREVLARMVPGSLYVRIR